VVAGKVSGVEGADGLDDGLLFLVAEFGEDGQGKDFLRCLFAEGEVSLLVAEPGETGLKVEGDGVVDLAADVVLGEVLPKGVASRSADNVLVEDVGCARVGDGQDDALGDGCGGEPGLGEELVIANGELSALLIPEGKVAEFYLEDGGLDGVQT